MKKILSLFLAFVFNAYGGTNENPYQKITERNAFELTDKEPAPPLPPAEKILAPNIFLTGISRWKGTNKVHLVLRKTGEPDKFVSLGVNEKQYDIELKKILRDAVLVSTDGNNKLLSFENNGLPTIITKPATAKRSPSSSRYSRDRREDSNKKEEKKISPQIPKPQIVTVPSRRPQADPRIIEKGLEYLSKMEDGEKRDYLLKRMESIQSGEGHSRRSK
jgi:hypothetical protein